MMKTIFLIAFLFFGMQAFTDKDTQENKTAPQKEPVRIEQQDKLPKEDEEGKALMKSIVLAILPPQEEWPAPVQKFFLALNMEEVINPLR